MPKSVLRAPLNVGTNDILVISKGLNMGDKATVNNQKERKALLKTERLLVLMSVPGEYSENLFMV